MRSPQQVELRAKARGLKIPTEFIVSHRSGVSLVRDRKRTRPGARPGRTRAVILRGSQKPSKGGPSMSKSIDQDHDHDPDRDPDRDNAVAPAAPKTVLKRQRQRSRSCVGGSALAALTALGTVLAQRRHLRLPAARDCRCCSSRPARTTAPGCSGRRRPSPKTTAAGPSTRTSFKWGYICFDDNNKRLGERLVPVSQPMPDVAELPDTASSGRSSGRST